MVFGALAMWVSLPSLFFLILSFSSFLLAPRITASVVDQFGWDGKVLELHNSNFDLAISSFDYIFVDFYAPWCGHCKRLAPELDKAAPLLAGLKPPVVVAKIDADKHRSIASKHEIDGYPTLKIFMHGVATEYFGSRKADQLVQFLRKFVAPDVAILDSDFAIREFVEAAGSSFPIFIGFGLNESTISNFGVKYKKKAWFSVARNFSDDIFSSYDFDKVPALVALHPTYDERSVFYGPFEEEFLQDYVKQSLLPLVFWITQDSLRLLKDEERKIVVTFTKDEEDERNLELLRVLKAAATANRDLIFGYVGLKQWPDFVESFEVCKKSQLPKMVVWDRGEEYETVIGSESVDMNETELITQVSKFLQDYREGNVIHKRISGPTLMGFMKSRLGVQVALIAIVLVLVIALILLMTKDEAVDAGSQEPADTGSSSTSQHEARASRRTPEKED